MGQWVSRVVGQRAGVSRVGNCPLEGDPGVDTLRDSWYLDSSSGEYDEKTRVCWRVMSSGL